MSESTPGPETPDAPQNGAPQSGPDPSHPSLLHEPPPTRYLIEPGGSGYGSGFADRPPAAYQPYQTTGHQAPAATQSWSPGSLLPATERNWAVAAHLSGFVAAFFALGFLGPLVVLLAEGRRSAYVRAHAVEALNFNLSVLLWLLISGVLVLVLIGIPMLVGVGILYLVSSILGAMAASRGDTFRYPLTVRFVH